MLFYSIKLLHVHITCLHIFFVYIYLHLLAQDARLCHGRGKDHRILWTIVNASGRLRLHGFGGLRCACRREASRSPPPPKYPSKGFCRRQGHQGRVTACGRRRRPDCRSTRIADRCSLGNCRSSGQGHQRDEGAPTMDKTMASPWTLWSPQVQPAATGRRPQRRRRRLRSAQEGALIRRLGLVDSVPP